MAFTKHGHHIPGTDMDNKPLDRARCGGVGLCHACNSEVNVLKATGGIQPAKSNDDVTTRVLLEYLVRDLKQLNQTRSYIPIEDVVVRLERIIHN